MKQMKTRCLFLLMIATFFVVDTYAQSQHILRNQFGKNVLIEIPSAGIRKYLGAVNSGSNTSSHLFYNSTVLMKVTVDYEPMVEVRVSLDGEYIDINQKLLDKDNDLSSKSEIEIVGENDYRVSSNKSKESFSNSKEVLFINTTDYKMVGKSGALKGLTLMPGDSISSAIIRFNKALRYNLFEGNYIDDNNTVLKKENANKLLSLYNSSAKIKWLTPGIYEENFKVFLTKSGERDKIGALLILQFKVDDNTEHVVINNEDINKNLPHGKKRQRDVVNESNKKIQLTIGGTQKVISSKKGRRFSKVRMKEKLANGYYYISVSLITNKAIQRDLLLLVSENQRHFIIEQDDIDQVVRSDYQEQGF